MKHRIANTPELVGATGMSVRVEDSLASGDVIDVVFRSRSRVLAVEVKGASSPPTDLIRGVFQTVKYQAVLEAELKVAGERTDVASVLAIGGALPPEVRRIANTLGVSVVDGLG